MRFLSLMLASLLVSHAADTIKVDVSNVLNHTTSRAVGINFNYLRDDNSNRPDARSLQEALKEMGVGWVRYPGGEKSDWHFWSQAPWNEPDPQVFGSYTRYIRDILDFDEYIAYVREAGAEPYVVVGYDNYNRTGKTKEEYLENAVEWVRYANVKKKYNVKYWEIGNENWHNNTGTPQEIADIVTEFSRAMKTVDPSIKIGASGNNTEWWAGFLPGAEDAIDFLTVSDYPGWQWGSFEHYRNTAELTLTWTSSTAVQAINDYVSGSRKDSLFVVSAELNTKDWDGGWADRNDLGHALVTFEIYGQILMNEKIRFGAMWTTRWMDDTEPNSMWYGLGPDNEILAAGRAVAVWGQFLGDRMVGISRTDKLVTFASLDPETGRLSLFVTNKDTQAHELVIDVAASLNYVSAGVFEFSGSGSEDTSPEWTQKDSIPVLANRIQGYQAPATSLTVFSLVPEPAAQVGRDIRETSITDYSAASIYTLNGRLVRESPPGPGLYIIRLQAGVKRKVMF